MRRASTARRAACRRASRTSAGSQAPRPGVGLYRQIPRAFADDDRPVRP